MKRLISRDNPLIKEAVKLKQKKYRQQTGLFLMEGERMIREALNTPDRLVRLFVDQQYVLDPRSIPAKIDCFQVDAAIIKAMTDTEHPQGVVAVMRMYAPQPQRFMKRAAHLVLLDRVSDPGNLGTIIRTAWAFDAGAVLLTAHCADPYSPKAVRSSMGGILHMSVMQIDAAYVDGLIQAGYRLIAATPDAKETIYEADLSGAAVFVIGSEAHGLGEEWLGRAGQKVSIPINPRVDSLNAAVSCAIIMSEACRQRQAHS